MRSHQAIDNPCRSSNTLAHLASGAGKVSTKPNRPPAYAQGGLGCWREITLMNTTIPARPRFGDTIPQRPWRRSGKRPSAPGLPLASSRRDSHCAWSVSQLAVPGEHHLVQPRRGLDTRSLEDDLPGVGFEIRFAPTGVWARSPHHRVLIEHMAMIAGEEQGPLRRARLGQEGIQAFDWGRFQRKRS